LIKDGSINFKGVFTFEYEFEGIVYVVFLKDLEVKVSEF